MNDIDCVVIGAGVIGLAVARALALRGQEVLIIERETRFGAQTSSRNSEVIHAGLYYEPSSLKALSCVAGRESLYRYCNAHDIGHRKCGKYIVAADTEQIPILEQMAANARACNVLDLEWLDAAQARREEPQLACAAVLHSPSTGIIDSHEYMLSLLGEAEGHGASIVYGTSVRTIGPTENGAHITIDDDAQPALRSRIVVNAAGLDATEVAKRMLDFPAEHIPPLYLAKGNYFASSGAPPFRRLIYPVPEPGGLGVHMTVDLDGRPRFGPDVQWVDDINYTVEETRVSKFYAAIRRYWPALKDGQLYPAYAGIRPKLSGPGQPAADFKISSPADHGIPGIINLFGIESPGLTASLDIADRVARSAELVA